MGQMGHPHCLPREDHVRGRERSLLSSSSLEVATFIPTKICLFVTGGSATLPARGRPYEGRKRGRHPAPHEAAGCRVELSDLLVHWLLRRHADAPLTQLRSPIERPG